MRCGLSGRRRLPALFLENSKVAFPLYAVNYIRRFEKYNFALSPYAQNVVSELRGDYYRPPFSLAGKTVLDLGACCGESAWYFLEVLKAKKVICVECDPQNIALLKHNRAVSGLNFEVVPEAFKLAHLELPFDFLKCDIEGGETLLVDYIERNGFDRPCVVEVHNDALARRFSAAGFRAVKTFTGYCFNEIGAGWMYTCRIMNNFGR